MDNWKNILDEDILKTNINFAAIFVMNYECLKEFIIEQVRSFYSEHIYMDSGRINAIQLTDFLIKTVYHNLPNIENIVQLGNSEINKWTFTSTTAIERRIKLFLCTTKRQIAYLPHNEV